MRSVRELFRRRERRRFEVNMIERACGPILVFGAPPVAFFAVAIITLPVMGIIVIFSNPDKD